MISKAQQINGNGHYIYAGGLNEKSLIRSTLGGFFNAPGYYCKKAHGDSGGGGGAGGTVLLSTSAGYTNALNVEVRGGRGDSVYTDIQIDLGPGGGGGGGVIWVNEPSLSPNIIPNVTFGVSGLSWNFATNGACICAHKAEDGIAGSVLTNLVIPESTTPYVPPCVTVPVTLINFSGKETK